MGKKWKQWTEITEEKELFYDRYFEENEDIIDDTLLEDFQKEFDEEQPEVEKEYKPKNPLGFPLLTELVTYQFVATNAPRMLKLRYWILCKLMGITLGEGIIELIRKAVESNGHLLVPPNQK